MYEVLQFGIDLFIQLINFIFEISLVDFKVGHLVIFFFILNISFKLIKFFIGSDISIIRVKSYIKQNKGGS